MHREGELLGSYNLLLSVGHDEYWSEPMRRNITEYIEEGGNVAFFSGNCCWYRVHYVDDDSAMICDKRFVKRRPGSGAVATGGSSSTRRTA